MVDLDDPKAKAIAEVIGNKTCKKILDFLAENESTVSEVSLKLKIPINTVDYNIKKLLKAGLIEKSSFWWSVKGKNMPTYKVSNKQIIISPRKSLVKAFMWVLGITSLSALSVRQIMNRAYSSSRDLMGIARDKALEESSFLMVGLSEETQVISSSSNSFFSFLVGINPWEWFLIGAWFAILLFFVITLINKGRLDK